MAFMGWHHTGSGFCTPSASSPLDEKDWLVNSIVGLQPGAGDHATTIAAVRDFLIRFSDAGIPWVRIYHAFPAWQQRCGLLTEDWDRDDVLSKAKVIFTLIDARGSTISRRALGKDGAWSSKGGKTIGNDVFMSTLYYKRDRSSKGEFTAVEFHFNKEKEPKVAICVLHQTGYIHSVRDLTRYVDKGWFPGGNQENLQMAQPWAPPTYKEPSYLAESMNGTQLTAALCDITNHGQPSAVSSSEVLPPSVSQNAIQQFQFPLNNLVFEKSLGQPSYPSWSWNIPPQVPRQIGYHDENSFSLGASGNNSMFETLDSQFAPSWDVLPQIVSQGADLHNSMLETAGQHTWMGSSSMDDQEARTIVIEPLLWSSPLLGLLAGNCT